MGGVRGGGGCGGVRRGGEEGWGKTGSVKMGGGVRGNGWWFEKGGK